MLVDDTIVAIATPPANGAVGVMRVSGPHALAVMGRLFLRAGGRGVENPVPRHLYYGDLRALDGRTLDRGLAVFMPGPASFTGEDVVEFHCHGGIVLLKAIQRAVLALPFTPPVRAATPGEFTRRAFLNGKLDLTQAEAVHALINADSEVALRASLANLDGALSRRIAELRAHLRTTLALVEASFEFPEEDIQTYERPAVFEGLRHVEAVLHDLLAAYHTSRLYDEGVGVALVGRPNVGKSSLLNAILIEDRAIVSAQAGTTRDVVEGARLIDGIRFVFKDTAGLCDTSDPIEAEGVKRSRTAMSQADVILHITDVFQDPPAPSAPHRPDQVVLSILNKSDLIDENDKILMNNLRSKFDLLVSAKCGNGLPELLNLLKQSVVKGENVLNYVQINLRQRSLIEQALVSVRNINKLEDKHRLSDEILAEELRDIMQHLGEITGEISSEDVLGEIFQRFCIGK